MSSPYAPDSRRRRSIRLRGYDYSQVGAYFVTVVVQGRACLFGDVIGEEMRLNDAGEMIRRVWQELPGRFPGIALDTFILMPNHLHGIISIDQPVGAPLVGAQKAVPPHVATRDSNPRATTRVAPTGDGRYALGDVVGAFKSLTTVEYVRGVKTLRWPQFYGKLWQRNYFEHVVRSEESLTKIRQYIRDNPARWAFDRENPMTVPHAPEGP